MPEFRADLHVHTCLSPCGELSMSPMAIAETAKAMGLDIVGICDHNSAENAAATVRAARRIGGPVVLSGLEVTTAEEVHVLALFQDPETAEAMQAVVYAHLPPKSNRPDIFGEQVVVSEDDDVEGFNERLLIAATDLDIDAMIAEVHRLGGLAVPSHIDRPGFGLLNQLGFLPPDLAADALEISRRVERDAFLREHPEVAGWPLITSSDAHDIADLGTAVTILDLTEPTLAQIRLAFRGLDGRARGDCG